MKTKLIIAAMLFAALSGANVTSAQEGSKFGIEGSASISSNYIWRGTLNCGVNFMPDICLSYGNAYFDVCGYVAFDGSYNEIDLELGYSFGPVTVSVADYFCPIDGNAFSWKKIPAYDFEDPTNPVVIGYGSNHTAEAIVAFEPENIPITATWSTFIYGFWNSENKACFSSFLNIGAYHSFDEFGKASVNAGAGIFKGVYAEDKNFVVNHIEFKYEKEFEISDKLSLPLSASYILNPFDKLAFVNATIGIKF